jgi:hypothetical protein
MIFMILVIIKQLYVFNYEVFYDIYHFKVSKIDYN